MSRRRPSERDKKGPSQRQLRVGEELRHLLAELLERPEIDIHLTSARVDRAELLKWFEGKKIEVLNDGRTVPATSPNTDFFPRDEYYLNRP